MNTTTAIIDFIASLHGVDRLQRVSLGDQRPGAFDMLTSQSIETSDDYPNGEMLVVERVDGQKVLVHSFKLLDALILRTAQAYAVAEGGTVKSHYEKLKQHLSVKTGYAY